MIATTLDCVHVKGMLLGEFVTFSLVRRTGQLSEMNGCTCSSGFHDGGAFKTNRSFLLSARFFFFNVD